MTRKNISDVVGNISTRHLEEAENYSSGRTVRKSIGKWVAVAACLCVVIGTTTVFAATGLGTRLIHLFTADTNGGSDFVESGFDLSVKAEEIPEAAIAGDIREVHDILIRQFKNGKSYDSRFPGYWQKSFSSSEDARKYVGLDLLKAVNLKLDEQETTLVVLGDSEGRIHELTLETDYTAGDIRMQVL